MRTQDEVRVEFNRLQENKDNEDFFGFQREVLIMWLPEHYKEGKKDQCPELTEQKVREELIEYLDFAFGKATNHRGLSAGRSIEKLSKFAWILGRDDLLEFAEDGGNYTNYGVPILKRFAQAFDVVPPPVIAQWEDGKPCTPDCSMGCSTE